MSSSTHQTCRVYADTLWAILETFGDRPFTAAELQEKGIVIPNGRNLSFFRVRGVIGMHRRGRPCTWVVTSTCKEYLKRREAATA
jgi:hypothetical protein